MEWISVKEKLPPDRVDVLIYNEDGKMGVSCYLEDFSKKTDYDVWEHREELYQYNINFWMPLPNAPEE